MPDLEVAQAQEQKLKICPQLLQSMALLQMNVQDLTEYVNRALEENPMLERQERDISVWRQYTERYHWLSVSGSKTPPEPGAEDRALQSMGAFLCDQLSRLDLEHKLEVLCEYLVSMLDDNGRLDENDFRHLAELGVPQGLADEALGMLQSLEPAGIAARSLPECLLIQLRRKGQETPLLIALIEKHLDELSKKQYRKLAHTLKCKQKDINNAAELIAQLDPYPGRQFSQSAEPVQYVVPDAYILDSGDELTVMLNDFCLPKLYLSASYREMLSKTNDVQTSEYLKERLQSAKELIDGLDRRGKTLSQCFREIVYAQKAFFSDPQAPLAPLSRRELASRLKVHPSTVTRTLRGKYLQCSRGIYPLNYFFSTDVNGTSAQEIHTRIAQLLAEQPMLNDRELCEKLAGEGYSAARRTITKYRHNMGVSAAYKRKK